MQCHQDGVSLSFPRQKGAEKGALQIEHGTCGAVCPLSWGKFLAYQTAGNHECSLNYYGPELFPQRGFCIYQKTIQSHSTQVDASCIRELWLLEDGRFVDVSCVNTKYRSAYERFSTCYRTIHHIVRERDWQDYPAEEVADAFEDISRYPFDGRPGVFYEV